MLHCFLRARWLSGGDLLHQVVFREKINCQNKLLLKMLINSVKNPVFICCSPRVALSYDTSGLESDYKYPFSQREYEHVYQKSLFSDELLVHHHLCIKMETWWLIQFLKAQAETCKIFTHFKTFTDLCLKNYPFFLISRICASNWNDTPFGENEYEHGCTLWSGVALQCCI